MNAELQVEGSPKRAVVYLRVSTARQMHTAVDVDREGNSIATQREMCLNKAAQLGAAVVAEFVEPGNSAQSIERRPEFKKLIEYIEHNRDVDYVIVYMRSRAFRNSTDAAITKRALGIFGIRIVSCKEDFGTGPVADAMETVADAFNELQVRQNGEDIRLKLQHKKRNGGTISRAKLGYLNIRADHEGRLFNSIGLDQKRAPLIRTAFEIYAGGACSLEHLEATMADLGLTTRPSARWPQEKAVVASKWHRMLSDPYYAGWVVIDGELIKGRHDAIVDQELFDRVQDVLSARSKNGNRDRVHNHYLKGLLFCERCNQQNRRSRLVYTEARGRNGAAYPYYVCRGRQNGLCDLPHLPVDQVEDAVTRHYETLALPDGFTEAVQSILCSAVADDQSLTQELHSTLLGQLAKLDSREQRLIDLAADGLLDRSKILDRANKIKIERNRIETSLATTGSELAVGGRRLEEAINMAKDPVRLYRDSVDATRRQLNEAFYEALFIDDELLRVAGDKRKAPFEEIQRASWSYTRYKRTAFGPSRETGARTADMQTDGPSYAATDRLSGKSPELGDIFSDNVSSTALVVELRGFEPLTFSLRIQHSALPRA